MFRRCFRTFRDAEGIFLRSNLSTKASFKSESKWPGWELVVGLEVHAQIKSRAKLFSHAWTSTYDEQANTHVDIFDASFPGTLPKLNSTCVDLALRTAVALNSQIQYHSSFDRKHYFYSDIPSGYQITQYYSPFAKGGQLRLSQNGICFYPQKYLFMTYKDTAKSTFDPKEQNSVIDLNRAGTALMEIISEPDMKTPEQAGEYVKTLQALLRTVGSSDGNMEEGSLRCDVNVSVNKFGEPRGTRCEIKNLNSVKFMMVAIVSEALRHISLLEAGGIVTQETRGFDEHRAETFPMRSKEDTPDYRYMPDPNLPPLILEDGYVESVRTSMPELPEETRARLIAKGLSARDVNFLMSIDAGREVGFDGILGQGFVSFFRDVAEDKDPKVAINWITHDLYGLLIARKETFKDNPVSVVQLRELIGLVESKNITSTSGKQLLKYIVEQRTDRSPIVLAQELSLLALNSSEESFNEIMDEYCLKAIEELPEEAKVVRGGNIKVLNKLVGFVMKMSKGRADAQAVHIRLKNIIMNKKD